MNKQQTIADLNSCLNRAADDEPIFVLRAKDPHASEAVLYWAVTARDNGSHEPEKIDEALEIAAEMERYLLKAQQHKRSVA